MSTREMVIYMAMDELLKKARREARKKFGADEMDQFYVKSWITKRHKKLLAEQSGGLGKLTDEGDTKEGGRIERHWAGVTTNSYNDQFSKFGIVGIEFGNWVNQVTRQAYIESLYESLPILAKMLNVPQSTLGMNKLSIAVGARGMSAAAGHYERPVKGVAAINLTKTQDRKSVV